ncbi:MAG TPA: hypothetical protein DCX23_06495 [Lachnospiraceae bacterium]|nr:hypothetical protein [Lachnospiraceae bacterium]
MPYEKQLAMKSDMVNRLLEEVLDGAAYDGILGMNAIAKSYPRPTKKQNRSHNLPKSNIVATTLRKSKPR